MIILSIFDVTYLLRAGWDYNCFGIQTIFGIWVGSLCLSVVFDIMPLSLIMLFHYRNFSSLTITDNSVKPQSSSEDDSSDANSN